MPSLFRGHRDSYHFAILALGPALGLCGAAVTKCPAHSTCLCDGSRKSSGLSCVTYRPVLADGLDFSGFFIRQQLPLLLFSEILMEYSFVFHLYLVGVVVWRHF
jgi:hypothetical protein